MNVLAIHAKDADQSVAKYLRYVCDHTYRKWDESQNSDCAALPHGTLHAAATMAAALRLATSTSAYQPLAESILLSSEGSGECFWSEARSPIGKVLTYLASSLSFHGEGDDSLQHTGVANKGLDFVVADYTAGYRQFYRDKRHGLFPKVNGKKASRYLHAVSKVFPYWGNRDTSKLCGEETENSLVLERNLRDCANGDSLAVHCMLQVRPCVDTLWSYTHGSDMGWDEFKDIDLVRIQLRTNGNYRYVSGCWPLRLTHYLEQLIAYQNSNTFSADENHFIQEARECGLYSDWENTLHSLLSCLREIAGAAYYDAISAGEDPYLAKRVQVDNAMNKAVRAMNREFRGLSVGVLAESRSGSGYGESAKIQIHNFRFSTFNMRLRYERVMRESKDAPVGLNFTCETTERVPN